MLRESNGGRLLMTFDYATNATFECDKYTGHYGFQEDIKCDCDRELMNEPGQEE